uniref:Uncharacterized protein n=1 Tax=Anguilla anguilla TaxID=7936 RepID=A0A0E9WET3_ANGAN
MFKSDETLSPHALPIMTATCCRFRSSVFLLLRNLRSGN